MTFGIIATTRNIGASDLPVLTEQGIKMLSLGVPRQIANIDPFLLQSQVILLFLIASVEGLEIQHLAIVAHLGSEEP